MYMFCVISPRYIPCLFSSHDVKVDADTDAKLSSDLAEAPTAAILGLDCYGSDED